jgi:hypothetical protein
VTIAPLRHRYIQEAMFVQSGCSILHVIIGLPLKAIRKFSHTSAQV